MRSRVEEVTLADWDRVLAVNLTGPLLGIQALVPLMGAGGSIVNISSVAGLTGYHAAGYTVSKWGLRGLLASPASSSAHAGSVSIRSARASSRPR